MSNSWVAHDSSPMEDGDIGGDGAGTAWSVRWSKKNADGTTAVITAYYFPVDVRKRYMEDATNKDEAKERFGDNVFDVESRTSYLVCTDADDPGGSEVWSSDEYTDDLTLNGFSTEAQAIEAAKQMCAGELGNFERNYSWDGQPF